MGSVCASTMSLLNAGAPLKAPVAGIAMGLIKEGDEYVTLTDILGAEDAFGDMDFKVAGTKEFVTALQLDTKLDGIPASVLGGALQQAKAARLVILDVMNEAIDGPDEMSPYAPRVISIKIPVDKIGEVIGPKGKVINQIQADTGADISIEDDGTIYVGATDGPSAEAARSAIQAIALPTMPEVGERYLGTVVKTTNFGAFISLTPGKDGLLHVSKMKALAGGKRVNNPEDVVSVGQKIQVEIAEVDNRGKISLQPVVEESADGADDVRPSRRAGGRRRRVIARGVSARESSIARICWRARCAAPCSPAVCAILTETLPGRPLRRDRHLGRRRLPGREPFRRPAPRTTSSTCCSRAPPGAARWTSPPRSRRSAVTSTPSPATSTPATTPGCSTPTCRWRSTCCRDMVLDSLIRAEDVDAERGVVLEEIAMHDDDPGDAVHDVFATRAARQQPAGPADPRHASTRSRTMPPRPARTTTTGRATRPPSTVVAVSGALDHDEVVRGGPRRVRRAPASRRDADPAPARIGPRKPVPRRSHDRRHPADRAGPRRARHRRVCRAPTRAGTR